MPRSADGQHALGGAHFRRNIAAKAMG